MKVEPQAHVYVVGVAPLIHVPPFKQAVGWVEQYCPPVEAVVAGGTVVAVATVVPGAVVPAGEVVPVAGAVVPAVPVENAAVGKCDKSILLNELVARRVEDEDTKPEVNVVYKLPAARACVDDSIKVAIV